MSSGQDTFQIHIESVNVVEEADFSVFHNHGSPIQNQHRDRSLGMGWTAVTLITERRARRAYDSHGICSHALAL